MATRSLRRGALAWLVEASHVAMGPSIIAMVWASVGWDRWGVQLTLFGVLGGEFAIRGLVGGRAPLPDTGAVASPWAVRRQRWTAACLGMLQPAEQNLSATRFRYALPL